MKRRYAAPPRHLSNANATTGEFLLKISTGKAMLKKVWQGRETLLKLWISLLLKLSPVFNYFHTLTTCLG